MSEREIHFIVKDLVVQLDLSGNSFAVALMVPLKRAKKIAKEVTSIVKKGNKLSEDIKEILETYDGNELLTALILYGVTMYIEMMSNEGMMI